MLKKGISPLLSTIIIILLIVTAITLVLTIGTPAINRARESAIINEAIQNMRVLDNSIREVASEGLNSKRTMQLKVTDGVYSVKEKTDSINFEYKIKYGTIELGTFIKENNLIITSGASAKASEYDLDNDGFKDLVLENEILRVAILKVGSKDNYDLIDTNELIKIINFKETNVNVTPSDSSIVLDDFEESSYGNGYSELVKQGDNLAKAEALVHMNTTFVNYDILYTLQSGADFLIVKIINAYYK